MLRLLHPYVRCALHMIIVVILCAKAPSLAAYWGFRNTANDHSTPNGLDSTCGGTVVGMF